MSVDRLLAVEHVAAHNWGGGTRTPCSPLEHERALRVQLSHDAMHGVRARRLVRRSRVGRLVFRICTPVRHDERERGGGAGVSSSTGFMSWSTAAASKFATGDALARCDGDLCAGLRPDDARFDSHLMLPPSFGDLAIARDTLTPLSYFLQLEREADGHSRRQGGDRHRRGQRRRTGRGDHARQNHGAKVVRERPSAVSVTGEGADKTAAETVVEDDQGARRRGGSELRRRLRPHTAGEEQSSTHAIESFGRLDVLVNNAGILRDKMIFSMPEADFDAVIAGAPQGHVEHDAPRVGLLATASRRTAARPRASIVNTVSSAGLQGQAGQSNYGAAKAGIAAMTIIASLRAPPDAGRRAAADELHRPRRVNPHGRLRQ